MFSWPAEFEAAEFSKSLQKVWQQTEAELGLPSCSPALLADNLGFGFAGSAASRQIPRVRAAGNVG